MDNYIITIARSFGSGGKEIASLLSEKLGIPWYERQILTMASQASGIDESDIMSKRLLTAPQVQEILYKITRQLSHKIAYKTSDSQCFTTGIKRFCIGFKFIQHSGRNHKRTVAYAVMYNCRQVCGLHIKRKIKWKEN